MTCFQVPRSKWHRLTEASERFPMGRARCAPFPRLPADELAEPNQVPQKDFCRLCL